MNRLFAGLILLLAGCGGTPLPALHFSAIRHLSLPSEGPKIPAPRMIAVSPENKFLALDTAGRLLLYDPEGNLLKLWRMPDNKAGNPEGALFLLDGRIAVADTHYHQIVFFDQEGRVLGTMGSLGKEAGQFIYPVSLTQDRAGNFFVSEYGSNDRIQKFSPQGKALASFGSFGTEPGQFQRPSGMVWKDGKIYIADAINNRLQVFSDSGAFLGIMKTIPQIDLHFPYGLCLGKDGNLGVIEYGGGRVTRISTSGQVIGCWGSSGSGDACFNTPWGLAELADARLVVADTGNRRLAILIP